MRRPDFRIERDTFLTPFFHVLNVTNAEGILQSYRNMNSNSNKKLRTIANILRKNPLYAGHEIKSYAESRGIHSFEISYRGQLINKFVFCPDTEGNFESIAIYGENLRDHMYEIRQNMKIFGMEVDEVDYESGYVDYIDIYLKMD